MTQSDMIRLAHEAGWKYADGDDGYAPLWEFGQLVAAAEREACAKVLDEMAEDAERDHEPSVCVRYYREKAAAIRARGQS
jgi:hypothetical protein